MLLFVYVCINGVNNITGVQVHMLSLQVRNTPEGGQLPTTVTGQEPTPEGGQLPTAVTGDVRYPHLQHQATARLYFTSITDKLFDGHTSFVSYTLLPIS